jgi:superfamily II DNA helicase RecQ
LEGLVLRSPVSHSSIIRSNDIDAFALFAKEHEPTEQQLETMQKEFFMHLVVEQFSFDKIQSRLGTMRWLLNEHFKNLYPELLRQYRQVEDRFRIEVSAVSEQFHLQLHHLHSTIKNPWEDSFFQGRVQKAASYFLEKIGQLVLGLLEKSKIETDNKEVKKRVNDVLRFFKTEARIKQKTLEACLLGFFVSSYLSAKSKASIEDEQVKPKKREKSVKAGAMKVGSMKEGSAIEGSAIEGSVREGTAKEGLAKERSAVERSVKDDFAKVDVSEDILHPQLYEQLRSWRSGLAKKMGVPVYIILSQKALIGISNLLPADLSQMQKIPGVGKATIARYGEEIVGMVEQWQK